MALDTNALLGTTVQIIVTGIVGKWGTVDLTLKQLDKYNYPKILLERCCIEVKRGLQFSDAKVQGRVTLSKI
jgi:hypothetical protein